MVLEERHGRGLGGFPGGSEGKAGGPWGPLRRRVPQSPAQGLVCSGPVVPITISSETAQSLAHSRHSETIRGIRTLGVVVMVGGGGDGLCSVLMPRSLPFARDPALNLGDRSSNLVGCTGLLLCLWHSFSSPGSRAIPCLLWGSLGKFWLESQKGAPLVFWESNPQTTWVSFLLCVLGFSV